MLRRALTIAWPSILENLAITLTGMIDTIMVATIGTAAVAAVGLTAQPKFLFLTPFIASNVAVSALVARRKGADDRKEANRTLLSTLVAVSVIYVLIAILANLFADPILHLVGSNPEIHAYSLVYFRIILTGVFFNVISMTINSAHSGAGNTRIAFVSNLFSSLVNICFNYLLIGGHLGFPAMGTAGAAIATIIGQVVGCLISIGSLYGRHNFLSLPYLQKHHLGPDLGAFRDLFKLASNIAAENVAMRVGFIVTAMLAAGLGTEIFAVHNVGMNLLSFGFALANGMQTATVALTGAALGAGDKELALDYGKLCVRMGYFLSLVWALILFFFGGFFFRLHFKETEAVDLGIHIARFIIFAVFLQIQQIIYSGSLRAAGDVRYTLFASLTSVTLIRSIVTMVLVLGFHLGITGIWLGILSDQFSRFTLMGWRFRQGKWVELRI